MVAGRWGLKAGPILHRWCTPVRVLYASSTVPEKDMGKVRGAVSD